MMHVTAIECGQTQAKTNDEWTNHVGSNRSKCSHDSDADVSVVIAAHRVNLTQRVPKLL